MVRSTLKLVCAGRKMAKKLFLFTFVVSVMVRKIWPHTLFSIVIACCLYIDATGQTPTVQDCLGAIPICTEVYEESSSPEGAGNYANEINGVTNGGICCMDAELNSIWYTFTVNNSGEFGFELTPNELTDDYDWALFDITHASCQDIFTNASLQVSCNAAGSGPADGFLCNGVTGANGKSPHINQGGGCSFPIPNQFAGLNPHNALVPVTAGNTYVLVVSNWTASTNGYKIDFGLSSDIGIFDNEPPVVLDVLLPDPCGDGQILIPFSENVQIASINDDNFVLTKNGNPHSTTITSNSKDLGGEYDKFFTLAVDPPISTPGTYELLVRSTSPSDLLDLCGNPLSSEITFSFEITDVPIGNPGLPADTILCADQDLFLDITSEHIKQYLWEDGSRNPVRKILAPGAYSVTVSNACGEASATVNVQAANCRPCEIYVPNAITPNGDQINDRLMVYSDCVLQDLILSIYDRWGNHLFSTTDGNQGWDGQSEGRKIRSGVYLYQLTYQVTESGAVSNRTKAGDFVVIR